MAESEEELSQVKGGGRRSDRERFKEATTLLALNMEKGPSAKEGRQLLEAGE